MGEARAALTWADVRRRRLAAGRLTAPAEPPDGATIASVVGETCGIHAQLMPTAELSIGLRAHGATRTTVRDALWTERTLVKTYGLRGTVHLFPASELALWLAALRAVPMPERRARDRLASLGVTEDEAEGIVDAIGRVVEGRRLALAELEAEVATVLGGHVAERRGNAFGSGYSLVRSFLGDAALRGLVCFGPNEGQRVTYVAPGEWLGPQAAVDEREALATVVRRYLRAYGPSTPAEFAAWTATAASVGRDAFDLVRDDTVEVTVDGDRRTWLADELDAAADASASAEAGVASGGGPSVLLLPHFDVYLVGSRPRDEIVAPEVQAIAAARGLARYDLHATLPVLVVDGLVAGLWHRTLRARSVLIRVEPLVALARAARDAIEPAAERIGAILERTVELELGPIEARPHL